LKTGALHRNNCRKIEEGASHRNNCRKMFEMIEKVHRTAIKTRLLRCNAPVEKTSFDWATTTTIILLLRSFFVAILRLTTVKLTNFELSD
jgi:hypothetical protein